MRTRGLIEGLDHCLGRTAEVLRSGDFKALPELAVAMESLAAALAEQGVTMTHEELMWLRARTESQLRRLGAARDGVRAAVHRVEQIRRMSSEISTYDRDGRSETLQFAAQTLEYRA